MSKGRPLHTTMTKKRTLIGVVTLAHFVLWLAVLGLIRVTGFKFLLHVYVWLCFPLVLLPDLPWLPSDWFMVSLALVLNSSIWGITIGLLVYRLKRRFHRPVAS
jgi:hypothetical protein